MIQLVISLIHQLNFHTQVQIKNHDFLILPMPIVLKVLQFHLLLAFAVIINKSKGQTFDEVGLLIKDKNVIFCTVNYMSLYHDVNLSLTSELNQA